MERPKKPKIKKKQAPDVELERALDSLGTLWVRNNPERAERIIRQLKDQGLKP